MMTQPAHPGLGGFTLVEAIVALTLSTLLVLLVSSVFMAQSNFYDDVLQRSAAHDGARSVTELVASDVRRITPDGVIQADSLVFAARVPLAMSVICDLNSTLLTVFYPETASGLDTDNVTGYAVRDGAGGWVFNSASWGDMYYGSGATQKDVCGAAGVDTVGVPTSNFVRLYGPWPFSSPVPREGDPFLLVRNVQLEFAASKLDTGSRALYRGTHGDTLVEYASGLGEGAHFRYRLQGDSVFNASVDAADLPQVNAVRVVARARQDAGDARGSYEYELVQDVPLRNDP